MVNQKEEHDNMKSKTKSCLVIRGLREDEETRPDPPTTSKEALKVMLANAADENFTIRAMDVTKALMQGKPLERKAGPISWSSKKNSRVADSTKSAEMLAMD